MKNLMCWCSPACVETSPSTHAHNTSNSQSIHGWKKKQNKKCRYIFKKRKQVCAEPLNSQAELSLPSREKVLIEGSNLKNSHSPSSTTQRSRENKSQIKSVSVQRKVTSVSSSFSRFILTYVMIKERLHHSTYWVTDESNLRHTSVCGPMMSRWQWWWCHCAWLGSNPSGSFRLTPTSWHLSMIFFSVSVLPPSAASNSKHWRDKPQSAWITHVRVTTVCLCVYLHPSTAQQTGAVSVVLTDRDAGPAQKHSIIITSSPHFNPTQMSFKPLQSRALSISCRKNTVTQWKSWKSMRLWVTQAWPLTSHSPVLFCSSAPSQQRLLWQKTHINLIKPLLIQH